MRPDHPYFVKDAQNRINHPTGYYMWNGWGSIAHHSGSMFRYILNVAASRPEKTMVVSCCSDDMFSIPEEYKKRAEEENAVLIAPILCSFGPTRRREYMYIPASDDFFNYNMYDVFSRARVPWEQKKPLAVWRGGLSGEMLRINAAIFCKDVPYTDVKLIDNWPRPEYNPQKTPELFAERIEAWDQCMYKAVFWIDGNCIPSNVLWVFATGSVPVIISETYYWFKDKIKPWVHYVPVKADFSDLAENVRWIMENDDEARKIAENALEFCRTELTPEKQRQYIERTIDEHIRASRDPPVVHPSPIERIFPLLTFGGLAMMERKVRRRAALIVESMLECYKNQVGREEHIETITRLAKEIEELQFDDANEILRDSIQLFKKEITNE